MKRTIINKELVKFYLWVGLAYSSLWFFHNLTSFPGSFFQWILNNAWRLAYVLIVNFIFLEYTLPFILRKRRYIIYNVFLGGVLIWIHLMFWSFGLFAWRQLGIGLQFYTPAPASLTADQAVEAQMAYSAGSIFFFGIIRHIFNHVKLRQAAQQLRIQKQEAELNYLKSQTNPHFLFNTLNNIYSLARDKSDLAPEAIVRLSKILRFMLYETSGNHIPIEQEIKIIADYIALEQLRYDASLRINFSHNVEDMRQAIPPLLLIPLVENAFKHGVSETRSDPFIDIYLSVGKRQLTFSVRNSSETSLAGVAVKENIGLSNLRRQLELLYTDFSLSLRQGQSDFTATLKINLASHVENKMHHSRR